MELLKKFRRITYSTSYLPEIDGLRFIAIFSVVVILHITHYMDEKLFADQLVPAGYWKMFVLQGGNGVSLFFIISGFILSLPFARWRLNNQHGISLKYYYLRRLTRLEPPYLIALVILFIAQVWLLGKYSFSELLPHFFASAVYIHQFIYNSMPWVLPVAWSLEVEVQFYILAPLFCLLFLIRSNYFRWVLQVTTILVSALYWFDVWNVIHVFVYLHYFFTGILLADLYSNKINLIKNSRLGVVTGFLALAGFIFLPTIHHLPGFLLKLLCMFLLIHTALNNSMMKRFFSIPWMVVIGGMCYSIYLLHYAIVSAIGFLLFKLDIGISTTLQAVLLGAGMSAAVLFISSLFFLLVEKPFMRPMGLQRTRKV